MNDKLVKRVTFWKSDSIFSFESAATNMAVLILMLLLLSACQPSEGLLTMGSAAPSLKTKTVADVNGDLGRMTSYRYPDKRMYQVSVDEALTQGKPIVLEFATPGHCTVCDKQLQLLKGLMELHGEEVLFLHMDQYFNPEAFRAFKVQGDPWTFIIDRDGIIIFRQAGRVLYRELDLVIQAILKQPTKKESTKVAVTEKQP